MTPRIRRSLAWLALAGMASTAVAPWPRRFRGRHAAALRALAPWPPLLAVPMAIGAAVAGRGRLAVAAGAVGTAGVVMAAPMVVPRRQPPPDPRAAPLRITHTNLLYVNRRVGAVPDVLAPLDADVLTFSELTPTHVRRLHASSLADAYPHQVELAASAGSGTGLWSRHPLTVLPSTSTTHHTVVVDVHAPGGPVRVIVVHTQSPIAHHDLWVADLQRLAELRTDEPAIMTGDFNASWWHPELRDLLRAGNWRDAHQVKGRGLSCSWPTDQWHPAFRWHPPFVRIDHALVNDGLHVHEVGDFHVPGSDHLGIVVTVQRGQRATP
jgi:endonuclease/exonuclease/phosphatase family metal-dependent hydrolase